MADPTKYQFNLPGSGRPTNITIPEVWYPGVRDYWEGSTGRRTVDPLTGIVAVVIHATAGGSSAGAISVMRDRKASFHWLVPDEDEPQHGNIVWACAPESRTAWHVRNGCKHPDVNGGATRVNQWSLGIEIVNNQNRNDPFSNWQVEVTAKIVRYCWAKYPNLKHVVSHAKLDPTRRTDPGINFPWQQFKSLVLGGAEDPLHPLALNATPLAQLAQETAALCMDKAT